MSDFLTGEQILAADDLRTEVVNVKEWGGKVSVRTLCGAERDAFENDMVKARGTDGAANLQNIRARMVALCAVDGKGEPLFSAHDIPRLGAKSAKALDRVFSVCQRLNGLRGGDVEDLAGNSGSGPSAATGSASPEASA